MALQGSKLYRTGRWSLKLITGAVRRQDRLRDWEAKWSQEGYAPSWKADTWPEEVQDAVDTGWFPAGSALLDLGCGSGENAAWLADRGYDVLGVDFSAPAIARARLEHPESEGRLAFKVVDISREVPDARQFDALLDRGCFHGMSGGSRSAYVRNVAACSRPGARLLLYAETRYTTLGKKIRAVEDAFLPVFEVVKATRSNITQVPAVAIWMVRR